MRSYSESSDVQFSESGRLNSSIGLLIRIGSWTLLSTFFDFLFGGVAFELAVDVLALSLFPFTFAFAVPGFSIFSFTTLDFRGLPLVLGFSSFLAPVESVALSVSVVELIESFGPGADLRIGVRGGLTDSGVRSMSTSWPSISLIFLILLNPG